MVVWHEAPIVIPKVTQPHQLWMRPLVRLRLVYYKQLQLTLAMGGDYCRDQTELTLKSEQHRKKITLTSPISKSSKKIRSSAAKTSRATPHPGTGGVPLWVAVPLWLWVKVEISPWVGAPLWPWGEVETSFRMVIPLWVEVPAWVEVEGPARMVVLLWV